MYYFFTRTRLITFTISCVVLCVFSVILSFLIIPSVIDSQIDKNLRLQRGTDQWHRFVQIPFNLTFNVTFFEVTNADDVVNKKANPNLREKGPYIFDEVTSREILTYIEENSTLRYQRHREYYFNQTLTGPNLKYEDTLTIINPAYLAIIQELQDRGVADIFKSCLPKIFPDGIILKGITVKQILFDGYPICFTHFSIFESITCNGLKLVIEEMGSKTIAKDTSDSKCLVFFYLNYRKAPDGIYEVNTGMKDIMDLGEIITWNYSNYTKFWKPKNSSCDFVEGTDSTIFPPHIQKNSIITAFSSDLCRTVNIYYQGSKVYKGIEGYVFKTKPTLYHSTNATKDCFCTKGIKDTAGNPSCFLDGVLDVSSCFGGPVLASYPHFLYAEKYLQNLTGLSPDPEKHGITVLLDKETGVPLQAHQRLQLSLVLRPLKGFSITNNFPRTLLPLLWIDEGLDLPDIEKNLLDSLLYNTLDMVDILKWVFMGTTLGLSLLAILLLSSHLYSS